MYQIFFIIRSTIYKIDGLFSFLRKSIFKENYSNVFIFKIQPYETIIKIVQFVLFIYIQLLLNRFSHSRSSFAGISH